MQNRKTKRRRGGGSGTCAVLENKKLKWINIIQIIITIFSKTIFSNHFHLIFFIDLTVSHFILFRQSDLSEGCPGTKHNTTHVRTVRTVRTTDHYQQNYTELLLFTEITHTPPTTHIKRRPTYNNSQRGQPTRTSKKNDNTSITNQDQHPIYIHSRRWTSSPARGTLAIIMFGNRSYPPLYDPARKIDGASPKAARPWTAFSSAIPLH